MLDLNKLYLFLQKYIHCYDIFKELDFLDMDLKDLDNILMKIRKKLYNKIISELANWSISAKNEIYHVGLI